MNKLILLVAAISATLTTFAQKDFTTTSKISPEHPFDTRIGNEPDVIPDSIIISDPLDKAYPIYTIGHRYGTGDNGGMIDTMSKSGGAVRQELFIYSKFTKKLAINAEVLTYYTKFTTFYYEYDANGRRTKERIERHQYDANQKLVLTDKDSIIYDIEKAVYKDNGYTFEGTTYTFDSQNRLISSENDNSTIIYTYDDSGIAYSMLSTTKYDGYSVTKRSKYNFLRNGLVSTIANYKQEDDGTWTQENDISYKYIFNPGNSTSNLRVATSGSAKVYAGYQNVTIETEAPEKVQIYNISGQLVQSKQMNSNIEQIALSSGAYVVLINQQSYKIIVQ